jgi:hypothetical protein
MSPEKFLVAGGNYVMPALLSGSANILILTVNKYNEDVMFADGMILGATCA